MEDHVKIYKGGGVAGLDGYHPMQKLFHNNDIVRSAIRCAAASRNKPDNTQPAASSRMRAAPALAQTGRGVMVGRVALNWRASRNDGELASALANPGAVFQKKVRHGNFVKFPRKEWRRL